MAYWQHFRVNNINGTGVTAEAFAYTFTVASSTVSSLGTASVYNSSFQGVNGTFFSSSEVLGIAIANGAAVRSDGGLKNGNASVDRNRSTMYRTNSNTVGVARVVNASSLPGGVSNLKWAIGGLGLYLNESLTKSQYDAKLADEAVSGVGGVNDKRPRTMVGYIPSGGGTGSPEIAVVVVRDFNDPTNANAGITFYDGRMIMNGLGCTAGIHLDGGSSTSIRFIDQPQDTASQVIRYRATTASQKTIVRSTETDGSQRFPTGPSNFIDIY
jgi:exopolysaccharide biosynthesis protein